MVTRVEAGLPDILEIKLGSRVRAGLACWNCILERRKETEGERDQDTTEKDGDTKIDQVIEMTRDKSKEKGNGRVTVT